MTTQLLLNQLSAHFLQFECQETGIWNAKVSPSQILLVHSDIRRDLVNDGWEIKQATKSAGTRRETYKKGNLLVSLWWFVQVTSQGDWLDAGVSVIELEGATA